MWRRKLLDEKRGSCANTNANPGPEPNPNPDLGREEDFAESARAAGVNYEDLIQRVLTLGVRSMNGK